MVFVFMIRPCPYPICPVAGPGVLVGFNSRIATPVIGGLTPRHMKLGWSDVLSTFAWPWPREEAPASEAFLSLRANLSAWRVRRIFAVT